MNGIFYQNNYYLIPDEFLDYDHFIQSLINRPLPAQYSMVKLIEDHNSSDIRTVKGRSMAPYFLSGYHDQPETVEIDSPQNVYYVQVEVMDQNTYNANMREVINRICPGCHRFKPLTNREQSLNGHFEEMTLDGVCVFRQDGKPAPRSFRNHLFSFGGFYVRGSLNTNNPQEILEDLKSWFYTRYENGLLESENGKFRLILRCNKNELLLPALTDAISRYMQKISFDKYQIQLSEQCSYTRAYIHHLLSADKSENFRKDCKKYGVSLGVLEYDSTAVVSVRQSIKPLIDHFWLFPLLQEEGREYYLLSDTSEVLKQLRFRAPLLQSYHATFKVYDQYQNRSYNISFCMNCTPIGLDIA